MHAIFGDILGHSGVVEHLSRVLDGGTSAHAYVFSGARGLGKAAVAQRMVAGLLGVDVAAVARHSDVVWLPGPHDIDAIREACGRLSRASYFGRNVLVIDDAETLRHDAQNALLKTLEEPSGQATVILIAHDAGRVLPTILSRSVHLPFTRMDDGTIREGLIARGFGGAIAEKAAKFARGAPGRAMALADPDRLAEAEVLRASAQAFAEAPTYRRFAMVQQLAKGDDAQNEDDREAWLEQLAALLEERLTRTRDHRPLSALLDARRALNENGNAAIALEHIAIALN